MTRGPATLVAALLVFAMPSAAQIHVDTDSGFFADDGVALTMLLRSPVRDQVKGISVVSGNVWSREGAGFMSRTAKLLGKPDLPVLIGSDYPLIHTQEMTKQEQPLEFAGAFSQPLPTANPPRGGVDLLLRNIEAAPGKLTILAIGPLTNIALALRLRPDLETKIGAIVIMGGAYRVPGNASKAAEFNFWFDPEAARIVLRSAIPKKILFALDVCNTATFSKALFDQVVAVKTPITDLYREDFGNRYPGFLKNPKASGTFWDELAAAWIVDPSIATKSEPLYLDVATTFGPAYGKVQTLDRTLSPKATPVTFVTTVDVPRVTRQYLSALTAR
jgi:inosine-uridine nucleoside N-ribohydrolase